MAAYALSNNCLFSRAVVSAYGAYSITVWFNRGCEEVGELYKSKIVECDFAKLEPWTFAGDTFLVRGNYFGGTKQLYKDKIECLLADVI